MKKSWDYIPFIDYNFTQMPGILIVVKNHLKLMLTITWGRQQTEMIKL